MRLLEVVSHSLVIESVVCRSIGLKPGPERLVEPRPTRLWDRVVSGLADQKVRKLVASAPCTSFLAPLPHTRDQSLVTQLIDRLTPLIFQNNQASELAYREGASDYRRGFNDVSFLAVKLLESSY